MISVPFLLRCLLILLLMANGILAAHAGSRHERPALPEAADVSAPSCHEAVPAEAEAAPASAAAAQETPSCCQGGGCACVCVAPVTLRGPLATPLVPAAVRAAPPALSLYRSCPLSLPLRPPIA